MRRGRLRLLGIGVVSAPVIIVVLLAAGALGQELIDHAIVSGLPPIDRVSEYTTTDGCLHSWVNVGPIDDVQKLTWRFFSPDGRLWIENGPIAVGAEGVTYAMAPVAQEFIISDDVPLGQWRVDVFLNEMRLVTDEFRIVTETVLADYGDAPDDQPCGYAADPTQDVIGRFPTLYETSNARVEGMPGAHAAVAGGFALGSPSLVSRELGAMDPEDPDRVPNLVDDDIDDALFVELLPSGAIRLQISVARDAHSPTEAGYLNVLYDLNRDGQWQQSASGDEWILTNLPVDLAPGEEKLIALSIPVDQDWMKTLSEPRWLRLALTSDPIDEAAFDTVGGWDGSGAFAVGEIEDHKIGAATVEDLKSAVRRAHHLAWAAAYAHASALAWNLSALIQTTSAIAFDYDSAFDSAYAADSARDRAQAYAADTASACESIERSAMATATAIAATPCGSVRVSASAAVQASVRACASANAWAAASASAAADARASAHAWSDAAALAWSRAKAASLSFSMAAADAWTRAASLAEAWAKAESWAEALASVIGQSNLEPGSIALAAAWADAHAKARAWAATAVGVHVSTLTFTYVETVAEALAWAHASADAAAFALAQADAWANAAANAVAIADASGTSIAETATSISNSILTDCCDEIVPQPEPCDCPPCEPTPCPTVSCPPCERTQCPELTCPECPPPTICPSCPECPSTEPRTEDGFPTVLTPTLARMFRDLILQVQQTSCSSSINPWEDYDGYFAEKVHYAALHSELAALFTQTAAAFTGTEAQRELLNQAAAAMANSVAQESEAEDHWAACIEAYYSEQYSLSDSEWEKGSEANTLANQYWATAVAKLGLVFAQVLGTDYDVDLASLTWENCACCNE